MKIKVEGIEAAVILTIECSPRKNEDAAWTASPKGIIGADKGYWVRADTLGGAYRVVFYGTERSDEILMFDQVAQNLHENPFKRWQTGTGRHLSAGGKIPTTAAIVWKVLTM